MTAEERAAEMAAMVAERDAAVKKSNDPNLSYRDRHEWAQHAWSVARAIRRAEAEAASS